MKQSILILQKFGQRNCLTNLLIFLNSYFLAGTHSKKKSVFYLVFPLLGYSVELFVDFFFLMLHGIVTDNSILYRRSLKEFGHTCHNVEFGL